MNYLILFYYLLIYFSSQSRNQFKAIAIYWFLVIYLSFISLNYMYCVLCNFVHCALWPKCFENWRKLWNTCCEPSAKWLEHFKYSYACACAAFFARKISKVGRWYWIACSVWYEFICMYVLYDMSEFSMMPRKWQHSAILFACTVLYIYFKSSLNKNWAWRYLQNV